METTVYMWFNVKKSTVQPNQLVEGVVLSVDVVDAIVVNGVTGGLVPANCCWTAATSLGSIPASRIPDPGPSSRAKTGAVAGLVGCLVLPFDAICSRTVSFVGWVADSTYVPGCVPAGSFCADTLLSARTNCKLAFNLAVGFSRAGWTVGDIPAKQTHIHLLYSAAEH